MTICILSAECFITEQWDEKVIMNNIPKWVAVSVSFYKW